MVCQGIPKVRLQAGAGGSIAAIADLQVRNQMAYSLAGTSHLTHR